MEELDKTIVCLCERIQEASKSGCIPEGDFLPELVKGLASLITAKVALTSASVLERQY